MKCEKGNSIRVEDPIYVDQSTSVENVVTRVKSPKPRASIYSRRSQMASVLNSERCSCLPFKDQSDSSRECKITTAEYRAATANSLFAIEEQSKSKPRIQDHWSQEFQRQGTTTYSKTYMSLRVDHMAAKHLLGRCHTYCQRSNIVFAKFLTRWQYIVTLHSANTSARGTL